MYNVNTLVNTCPRVMKEEALNIEGRVQGCTIGKRLRMMHHR